MSALEKQYGDIMSKIKRRRITSAGFLEQGTSKPYWAMETCHQAENIIDHYYTLIPHYYLIITSLLPHYYLIISSLLPHYYLIITSLLPHYYLIITVLIGNNEFIN